MVFSALSDLIFPKICIHCGKMAEESHQTLCSSCFDQIELLKQEGRCLRCFEENRLKICVRCQQLPASFKRIAGCFEHTGPAASLIDEFKHRGSYFMAKDLAALMVLQFFQLNWPMPDFIIPLPISSIHFFQRGYEQNRLLVQEMGRFLERPLLNILKKEIFADEISFKRRSEVSDRILLLVTDQIISDKEIRSCSELLQEGSPKAIYGLSFSCFK